IEAANASVGVDDPITFVPGITDIVVESQLAVGGCTLTIDGGASGVTVRRDTNSIIQHRIFLASADLTLIALTVTGGNPADGDGGGILTFGTLRLTNSTVSGNTASGGGGGISNFSGTVTVTNSTVS